MHAVHSLEVLDIYFCTLLDEELADIDVASIRGQMQGCEAILSLIVDEGEVGEFRGLSLDLSMENLQHFEIVIEGANVKEIEAFFVWDVKNLEFGVLKHVLNLSDIVNLDCIDEFLVGGEDVGVVTVGEHVEFASVVHGQDLLEDHVDLGHVLIAIIF